ncbi:uncharacterized protein PAN0_014c4940 [Moesziomyces antarcticus]|uniref:Uncharacterized protein n=2 Tax=Pseudozyma antarctica TaxID=84753 RepID=A0A081CJ71_PSEA2|nr:uncharacterized protein PAN0_014c4940 [Moesziomyces antarcticus]GAK66717.1 conserved hypothetical protein [Moesziomyces antarcticus]SPO47764.1 uncharacterized protein PSANT_05452 [Moesziomyces antarcticus]
MEKTFNDSLPTGAQRDQDNQQRAQQGEPQIPHAAGREQVASKDPKEYDVRGGPGSEGNKPVQEPTI